MSFLQNKLDRLEAFLERTNARSDAIARERPPWWNVAKIVLGFLCAARGVSIAVHSVHPSRYALAALFVIGGVYLAYEGASLLREKWLTARS